MKKTLIYFTLLILLASNCFAKKLYIYRDVGKDTSKFISSGWMGDYSNLIFTNKCFNVKKRGTSSIRITYTPQEKSLGWCGIFWKYPHNNWGEKKGVNLSKYKKLTFWARGKEGGEIIDKFQVGGVENDTASVKTRPIMLTKEWQKITINLKKKDLSNIAGAFCFIVEKSDNPDGGTFYLDEIVFK